YILFTNILCAQEKRMKKLGLIGGTAWHSTIDYYAMINRIINERHGDNTNPLLRIISLNQRQIHDLQRTNDWDAIADIFVEAALELQGVGVDGISLCANTPHKIFNQLDAALSIPVLHIADAIGASLKKDRLHTVGLIGTRFTMSEDFIKGRLLDRYQVKTIVPASANQNKIQDLLYNELSVGVFSNATKEYFLQVINSLADEGAQAVILGCTEFPILLNGEHSPIPLIDTVKCHCEMLTQYIMNVENPGS
ncbi:MAG: amino acid racemase, partial [Psychromonas sp.]